MNNYTVYIHALCIDVLLTRVRWFILRRQIKYIYNKYTIRDIGEETPAVRLANVQTYIIYIYIYGTIYLWFMFILNGLWCGWIICVDRFFFFTTVHRTNNNIILLRNWPEVFSLFYHDEYLPLSLSPGTIISVWVCVCACMWSVLYKKKILKKK